MTLSTEERHALHLKLAQHDLSDDGRCTCGEVTCNSERFEEHLIELAFLAGRRFPHQRRG